jgi:hypothetical protein
VRPFHSASWVLPAAFLAAAVAFPASAASDQPDPREIIRRSLQIDARQDELARDYTYLLRQDRRDLDGSGRVKERRLQTWDVILVDGSPYRRLVARDDKPLSSQEQKYEEERLRADDQSRRKETEEQRRRRITEWERKRRQRREEAKEIADAFDFTLAGEQRLDGRDVWVIDARPRPEYKIKGSTARALFPNVKARFWIDKAEYAWVRLEAETIDTVSLGLFLVRVAKSSRVVMEQTRVNGELWAPKRITVSGSARIFLVKNLRFELQQDFSEYKKFQAESRIVAVR